MGAENELNILTQPHQSEQARSAVRSVGPERYMTYVWAYSGYTSHILDTLS